GVLLRLEVGLEDRLQDQHHRHLHHAIPDRADAQRALLAIPFRDEHATHGVRSIRSSSQFGRQFVEPSVAPVRLDVLEGLAVHPRGAVVGPAAQVGELQDVPSVDLVVQPVEPIVRRSLRFGMQRRLEFLNLRWSCEAHANLPALMPLGTLVLNSGPFPPPELPGFRGTTGLSATPPGPACPSRASGWRSRASAWGGFPCCVCFLGVDMPLPLPRWDRWVKSLLGRPIPPVSLFANDDGLPHPVSGSAPTSLPFEACSAFTRVTACRFAAPPSGAFVSKAPTALLPPAPLR